MAGLLTFTSCDPDPYGSHWSGEENLSIGQYIDANQQEFSSFHKLLQESKLLNTLYGYNPFNDGYTLFMPSNEAIDRFISQHPDYASLDELVQDTSFIRSFLRYHIVKRRLHTDDLPDGAVMDSTLTGQRLSFSFFQDGDKHLIRVNNQAPITKSNLELTNGYIHVISEVLQQPKMNGFEWLQQQQDYSIISKAIELSGVKARLWWQKYTILAEPDSIYHRHGIFSTDDLIKRLATPGMSYTNRSSSFYKFTGYHIVGGEYYLNDLAWGRKKYWTLDSNPLIIEVGQEIKINPGIDTYGTKVNGSGHTVLIDYISPNWDNYNVVTRSGPVHTITDILYFNPLPD